MGNLKNVDNAELVFPIINNATPIAGSTNGLSSAPAIDYTFTDNGIYPVKLEVIDTSGAVKTQTVNVTINNVAPIVASILKPDRINEGELVSFTATATDPARLWAMPSQNSR